VIFHILKASHAFEHSDPLSSSTGSHSQLVSDSVCITSSFSLLAFLLSVSLCVVTSALPLLLGIYLELATILD